MTEKKPPVLLLDIDGVLNATATKVPDWIWPAHTWTRQHIDGFQITSSSRVVDFLTGVHEMGKAEIRWHTTWQDRALHVGERLGLPEFPVQECPEWPPTPMKVAHWFREGRPGWWKYHAAERILTEEDRRLVWVDDDLFGNLSAPLRQELKALGTVLLVNPMTHTGLDAGDLKRISEQLTKWNR